MGTPATSINIYEPLVKTGGILYKNALFSRLWVDDYQHIIQAFGGYWSARFSIVANLNKIEDWIANGLGRHVEAYDDALGVMWEGFVNKVTANLGPLSVVRGPLLDVANRVRVAYSYVDNTTTPPTVGGRETTADTDDADSQTKYGIIPKVLSIGGADEANTGVASAVRDTYLEEHKLPKTTKSLNTGATARELTATIEALGYVHWLNYPYNVGTTGSINASAKIANVIAASPNLAWIGFGSTNYITANTLQADAWEDEDRLALNVIKGATAMGDAAQARWLFGVYANRECWYYPAPTTLEYYQRLSDLGIQVETASGDRLKPWAVKPGKWLLFPDFLIGRTVPAALRDDPRAMFLESSQFSAPWDLTLKGGDLDTLPQLLAQYGLAGVGA